MKFSCLLALYCFSRKPSLRAFSFLQLVNTGMLVMVSQANPFHALYLTFVTTTDYFLARIQRIKQKALALKSSRKPNEDLIEILNDDDQLMTVFKKYNKVLRHLLWNLIQVYAVGASLTLLLFTIDIKPWTLEVATTCVAGYSLVILKTGVYVSELYSSIFWSSQWTGFNPYPFSFANLSLKILFRLQQLIKELSSLESDGQFVIGLRDGKGPATSRQDIFDLTMATFANTLILITLTH